MKQLWGEMVAGEGDWWGTGFRKGVKLPESGIGGWGDWVKLELSLGLNAYKRLISVYGW